MRWAFKKIIQSALTVTDVSTVTDSSTVFVLCTLTFLDAAAVSLHLSHRLPPETCHHQRTNDIIVVVFIIICPKLPDSFITFPSYAAACSCYSTGAHKQTRIYTSAHWEEGDSCTAWHSLDLRGDPLGIPRRLPNIPTLSHSPAAVSLSR